jgi:hypothetical protein
MSDTRWFDIETAVAAATRHFAGAVLIYQKIPAALTNDDRYLVEMAFMHAMQAGHTALEGVLLRILDLCSEDAPTGSNWHTDLIRRAANPVGERPVILHEEASRAADATRRFRSVATQAYDSFDHPQAAKAVESATLLIDLLPSEIARFRQAVDP